MATRIDIYDPDEEVTFEFASYVKERMQEFKISTYFIERETGINQSNISKILKGKRRVSLPMAKKILKAVNGKFEL